MRVRLTQVAGVGGVGAESVFDDDDWQVGMLLAKAFEPAAGGVPLGASEQQDHVEREGQL